MSSTARVPIEAGSNDSETTPSTNNQKAKKRKIPSDFNVDDLVSLAKKIQKEQKQYETQFVELKSVRSNQNAALIKKSEAIKNLMDEVKEKTTEVEYGKNAIRNLEAQLKLKEGIQHAINAKIKENDSVINELQIACNNYEKEIKDLKAQVVSKANTEIELQAQVEEYAAKIKRFQEKSEGRERTIKDLENQLDMNKKNEADLEIKLEKVEQRHKALLDMLLQPYSI